MYDDLAAADSLNAFAAGDSAPVSMFSASMVLRADGRTSRGSDFPGGTWDLQLEPNEKGEKRWRMYITLMSKLLQQELHYEGLFFGLQSTDNDADENPDNDTPPAEAAEVVPEFELRVLGQSKRWNVSGGGRELMEESSFSMIKMEVDRKRLIPSIKPWASNIESTPEELRAQAEMQRLRDQTEADELRQAIKEVREAKAKYPDDWRERVKPREGVDFWKASDAPEELVERDAEEEEPPLRT